MQWFDHSGCELWYRWDRRWGRRDRRGLLQPMATQDNHNETLQINDDGPEEIEWFRQNRTVITKTGLLTPSAVKPRAKGKQSREKTRGKVGKGRGPQADTKDRRKLGSPKELEKRLQKSDSTVSRHIHQPDEGGKVEREVQRGRKGEEGNAVGEVLRALKDAMGHRVSHIGAEGARSGVSKATIKKGHVRGGISDAESTKGNSNSSRDCKTPKEAVGWYGQRVGR